MLKNTLIMKLFILLLLQTLFVLGDENVVIDDSSPDPAILVGDADASLVDDEDAEPLQIDGLTGRRMYEGFRLIRAVPRTEEDLHVLRFISKGGFQSRLQG